MTEMLQHALAKQKQAALRQRAPSAALRRERLARLSGMLADHAEALIAAVAEDFGGRSRAETILAELLPLRDAIGHARRHLRGWMKQRRVPVVARLWPGRASIGIEPLGCVGIVSPWNYPILLSLMPAVDALAAGNRVMLKPSERSPACSELLRQLVAARFSEAEFLVVTGDEQIGRAFCALQFDHLLFTGSTAVGRQVAAQAASKLVGVTLELGGKSPVLLCEDAVADARQLARTAHSIAVGKFFNAGQTCLAPDIVLAPEQHAARVAEALRDAAARLYPSLCDNPDYTAQIDRAQYERQAALLQDAIDQGAEILRHPEDRPETAASRALPRKFPPTVIVAPGAKARVLCEEIFGPILPVLTYASLDEAIAFINRQSTPLALYCYGNDKSELNEIVRRTRSGGVTLNGTLLHGAIPALPFGGIGESGIGAYHGHTGFMRLSHQRGVYRTGWIAGFTALSPPHGKFAHKMLDAMLGRR